MDGAGHIEEGLRLLERQEGDVLSYSDMPISKIALTGIALHPGAVPNGVEAPRGGARIETSPPTETLSELARRVPMAMPPNSSKPSSEP